MFACAYGAAFGAIQHLPQIVPGLPELKGLPRPQVQATVGTVQLIQELGGLVGRFVARLPGRDRGLAARAAAASSRYRASSWCRSCSCSPPRTTSSSSSGGSSSPASSPWPSSASGGTTCRACIPFTCAGTGESFAANIGGRMIGTSAALLTTQLAARMPGATPAARLAFAAAGVGLPRLRRGSHRQLLAARAAARPAPRVALISGPAWAQLQTIVTVPRPDAGRSRSLSGKRFPARRSNSRLMLRISREPKSRWLLGV